MFYRFGIMPNIPNVLVNFKWGQQYSLAADTKLVLHFGHPVNSLTTGILLS